MHLYADNAQAYITARINGSHPHLNDDEAEVVPAPYIFEMPTRYSLPEDMLVILNGLCTAHTNFAVRYEFELIFRFVSFVK